MNHAQLNVAGKPSGIGLFIFNTITESPFLTILTLGLSAGFYAFTDTNVLASAAIPVGIVHALGQVFILFLSMYFSDIFFNYQYERHNLEWGLLSVAVSCFAGSIVAGFLMGTYLYLSNRLFNMHINEASSSLASPNYKNFLRLRVHERGVTIYPVGIRKVPKDWQQRTVKKDTYSFTGNSVESFLIEKPIEILNDKL
jgi:hypothetical protein